MWHNAKPSMSLHSTVCALNKLDHPQLYQLDSYLEQNYPILHERHTIFRSSEALTINMYTSVWVLYILTQSYTCNSFHNIINVVKFLQKKKKRKKKNRKKK